MGLRATRIIYQGLMEPEALTEGMRFPTALYLNEAAAPPGQATGWGSSAEPRRLARACAVESGLLWAWGQRQPRVLVLARDQGSHLRTCKENGPASRSVGGGQPLLLMPQDSKGPQLLPIRLGTGQSPGREACRQGVGAGPGDHPAGRHSEPSTATGPTRSPTAEGTGAWNWNWPDLGSNPSSASYTLHHLGEGTFSASRVYIGMIALMVSRGGCEG